MPTATPLHEACGYDGNTLVEPSLGRTRQLLESGQGSIDLEVKDDSLFRRTPLHHAADFDKSGKIVEMLIKHGANMEARTVIDATPLIIASSNNNPSAALVLLQHGANIKAQNKYGWTALHFAFYNANKEVAEIILNSVVDSVIASSSSSLSLGLGKGLEEARNLVMNTRDNSGKTVLDRAELEIMQWWETFQRDMPKKFYEFALLEGARSPNRIRIFLLGAYGNGKTSISDSLKEKPFQPLYICTQGIDADYVMQEKTSDQLEKEIRLWINRNGTHARFRSGIRDNNTIEHHDDPQQRSADPEIIMDSRDGNLDFIMATEREDRSTLSRLQRINPPSPPPRPDSASNERSFWRPTVVRNMSRKRMFRSSQLLLLYPRLGLKHHRRREIQRPRIKSVCIRIIPSSMILSSRSSRTLNKN